MHPFCPELLELLGFALLLLELLHFGVDASPLDVVVRRRLDCLVLDCLCAIVLVFQVGGAERMEQRSVSMCG